MDKNIKQRELDAWIAENVMGLSLWKETKSRITCILEPNEFVLSIPSKIVRARIGILPTVNFQPTTDPSAAMEVLKKCLQKGKHDHPIGISFNGDGWFCYEENKFSKTASFSETLELAICLFAKKLFSK